jgi:putative endopeptidase
MRPSLRRSACVLALATLVVVSAASAADPRGRSLPATAAGAGSGDDFLAANLDPTVDPGVDFFQYANGGWLAKHPIPESEAAWGISSVVNEQLYTTLRTINEQSAAATAAPGSDARKIGDFWATAMDTALAEKLGVHPLDAELARIDAVTDAAGAWDVAFAQAPLQTGAFYSFGVFQDERASDVMAVHLGQGGLGLPDRDFYFNADAGVATVRTEYVAHLARVLELLGRDPRAAAGDAAAVMAFETELARASRKLEDLRDPPANYHKLAPAEVTAQQTPSVDWAARLKAWGLDAGYVIVGQPEFFAALDPLVARTPPAVLRDYLRVRLVDTYAQGLAPAFDAEAFRFYGTVLSGQPQQRERWKRVLDNENTGGLGMVLGRIFVAEYFPEAAKQRYVAMVEAIRQAYRERIDRLAWMDASTKAKAHAKLDAITPKVGYPDHWKDTSALEVSRASYAANLMAASRWAFADMLGKFGKPVDRTEWGMTPQTYNAYYNPSNNEIVLPAAIFTIPGVADAQVDDAVAYGYAGASTIGHEITHGFDDQGRQFDAAGNLVDWWTAEDAARFNHQAEAMVRQFDGYEPLPGLHINGKASLGENIADYGGLLLGLEAFKKTAQYKEGKTIGGLTPLQRYFLGYALGWMSQQREARLRARLLSDVHAPAKWRVLGPLANIPEFHEAFGITPGEPMYRAEADRVRIW